MFGSTPVFESSSRETLSVLGRNPGQDLSPLWTTDSKRVIWTSTRAGGNPNLFWQSADGTGAPERLTTNATNQFPTSITPDGRFVVFTSNATDLVKGDKNGMQDVFVLDRTSGGVERVSVDSSPTDGASRDDGCQHIRQRLALDRVEERAGRPPTRASRA